MAERAAHLGDVHAVDDCKVLDLVGAPGQDLVHLHAHGVVIMAKADDDHSVLLLHAPG